MGQGKCSGSPKREVPVETNNCCTFIGTVVAVDVTTGKIAWKHTILPSVTPPTKRKNSRDLLHKYFRPRQVMSFNPLVDQFAIEVKTAVRCGAAFVFHKSVTTGCRVGCH